MLPVYKRQKCFIYVHCTWVDNVFYCSSPKSIAVQRSFQELMYVHIVYMPEICWIYTMWLWYDVMCGVCMHVYIIWVELSRVELLFFSFFYFSSLSVGPFYYCVLLAIWEKLFCRSLPPFFYPFILLPKYCSLVFSYIVVCSHVHCNKVMEMYRMEVYTHTFRRTAMYVCVCARSQIYCVEKAYNTFRIAFIMLFQKI